ncbi:MAG: protein kinase [Archangium sp.]|nr:protein kinase [Archangium sp.]
MADGVHAAQTSRVLLLEDDPLLGKAIVRKLTRWGWNVEHVSNGKSALEAIARGGYTALVADNVLPDMTGIDVLLKVRELNPNMSRILITGHPNPQAFSEAINKAHVHRFLTKPFSFEELVEALKVSADLTPNDTSTKYTLLRRIAVGGMAEVYLAKQLGPDGFSKNVVVKTMLPDIAQDPAASAMFLEEGRLAARFNHPHLGQVFEMGRLHERHFIAMEHVDGYSLRTVMREHGVLPLKLAIPIVKDLLDALDYVHSFRDDAGRPLNLVHRDVNPSNVMVTNRGCTKLVDFGIAKTSISQNRTGTGLIRGKLNYMSPEQARGEPIDHRADLYAVGSMLFEMVTGRKAYVADTEMKLMSMVQEGQSTAFQDPMVGIPPELVAVIHHALGRDSSRRYQTAAEFRQALAALSLQLNIMADAGAIADEMKRLFDGREASMEIDISDAASADQKITHPDLDPKYIVERNTKNERLPSSPTQLPPSPPPPPGAFPSRMKPLLVVAGSMVVGLAISVMLWSASNRSHAAESASTVVSAPPRAPVSADTPKPPTGEPNAPPSAVPPKPAPAASAPTAVLPSTVPPVPRPAAVRPATSPAPLPTLSTGRLTIHAPMAMAVWIDGEPRGSTPLTIELAAGQHAVKLVEGESGSSQTITALVEAGVERRVNVALGE